MQRAHHVFHTFLHLHEWEKFIVFILLVRPYLSSLGHVHCSFCYSIFALSLPCCPTLNLYERVLSNIQASIRMFVTTTTTKRNLLFLSLFLLVCVFYLWLWFFSHLPPSNWGHCAAAGPMCGFLFVPFFLGRCNIHTQNSFHIEPFFSLSVALSLRILLYTFGSHLNSINFFGAV